jgi:hypothetical protein
VVLLAAAARTSAVAIKVETVVEIVAVAASDVAVDAVAAAVDDHQAPEAQPAAAICRRRNTLHRKATSNVRPTHVAATTSADSSLADSNPAGRNLADLTIVAPKLAPVLWDPPNPAPKTKSFFPASRSQNIATSP